MPSPDVAGQSSAKPSESPASDNDVADPPARRVAEPAILVSTPPQSGLNLNAPIGELQADNVSMGAKNVPAERAPNSVGLPSNPAEAKAPNTEPGGQLQTPGGRPKLLKVSGGVIR